MNRLGNSPLHNSTKTEVVGIDMTQITLLSATAGSFSGINQSVQGIAVVTAFQHVSNIFL
jgi:hypothetical protein